MNSKILLLGSTGQLGLTFQELLNQSFMAPTRQELDLTNPQEVKTKLQQWQPSLILNASSFNDVENAADHRQEALATNAETPKQLAEYAAETNTSLVHFSTDYVFAGSKSEPYTETDSTDPINFYGESKLLGEQNILNAKGPCWVFRTSWLYSPYRKNFYKTMLNLAKEREELNIVSDQVGTPTYSFDLAQAVLKILPQLDTSNTGLYHLTNSGSTTWKEYAETIFELTKAHTELKIQKVNSILTKDYPTKAKRPLHSQLDCSKAEQVFGVTLPHWKEALQDCISRTFSAS